MPFGHLREARRGARRSDVIVVTKCKETLSPDEEREMVHGIQRYAGPKPVFFSTIRYKKALPVGNQLVLQKDIILVSGIAKINPLKEFCLANYNVLKHFDFPDHHRYTIDDMTAVEAFCKSQPQPFSILTTEKDMVKFLSPELKPFLDRMPWFYLPIEHVFLQHGLKFDEFIISALKKPGN